MTRVPTYPLYHRHLRLVCHLAALRVGAVTVAELAVGIFIEARILGRDLGFPKRRVDPGDVVSQEGRHGPAQELGRDYGIAGQRLLLEPAAVTVVPGGVVGASSHDIGVVVRRRRGRRAVGRRHSGLGCEDRGQTG